jgi:two-component system cell cycle sensor histidine kinase/response regulator CckA
MKKAKNPIDEAARLKSLKSLNILDTFPEVEFGDITHLASQICKAPMALISLIELRRKALQEYAFCGHAILQKKVFIIPGSIKVERFNQNPLVLGNPHIRFYAGASLCSPVGHALGPVCVLGSVPRELTPDQIFRAQILRQWSA